MTLDDKVDHLLELMEAMMATLDQVLAKVNAETTQLASLQTFINGIEQQLANALAGTALPAATQAKIDAVFAALNANGEKINNALNTVTPPAQPPTA